MFSKRYRKHFIYHKLCYNYSMRTNFIDNVYNLHSPKFRVNLGGTFDNINSSFTLNRRDILIYNGLNASFMNYSLIVITISTVLTWPWHALRIQNIISAFEITNAVNLNVQTNKEIMRILSISFFSSTADNYLIYTCRSFLQIKNY